MAPLPTTMWRLSVLVLSCALLHVHAGVSGRAGKETMTVCKHKCDSDCKAYTLPVSQCYSPPKLFPGDPQWGAFDVLDVCTAAGTLNRSFYASKDGSCSQRTDGFDLPLGECVGPFGKPRPWGKFACEPGRSRHVAADPVSPSEYAIRFVTSLAPNAPIDVNVSRRLAPLGADRLYALVKAKFFDAAAFFRVVPPNSTGCVHICGGVVQFGIAGTPAQNKPWQSATIADDPVLTTNAAGTLSFAMAGAKSRTTEVFFNLGDNPLLNKADSNPPNGPGFAPFGKITSSAGLAVARKIVNPTPGNEGGIDSDQYARKGNKWLQKAYPNTTMIVAATLLS